MSDLQKNRAIKEILDDDTKNAGNRIYQAGHHLNGKDKEIADAMGQTDGSGKEEIVVDEIQAKKNHVKEMEKKK